MAKKDFLEEIRALDADELLERLDDAKEEMFNLRFQRAIGQLENTARIKEVRRNVARIQTVLRQRQLAEALAQEDRNA